MAIAVTVGPFAVVENKSYQLTGKLSFIPVKVITAVRVFQCVCESTESALSPSVLLAAIVCRNVQKIDTRPMLILVRVAVKLPLEIVLELALCDVVRDLDSLAIVVILYLRADDLADISAARKLLPFRITSCLVEILELINCHDDISLVFF